MAGNPFRRPGAAAAAAAAAPPLTVSGREGAGDFGVDTSNSTPYHPSSPGHSEYYRNTC